MIHDIVTEVGKAIIDKAHITIQCSNGLDIDVRNLDVATLISYSQKGAVFQANKHAKSKSALVAVRKTLLNLKKEHQCSYFVKNVQNNSN